MKILFFLPLFISLNGFGQVFHLHNVNTGLEASFRGLSVVDDSIAWVAGTNGFIGRSSNARSWNFRQVRGYEKCDFRSIYAFDAQTALIANAGSPAYILRTQDGGANWLEVYRNEDSAAFFDGIDFWNNKEGIIYGDPLNGRMLLLRTNDGGKTWKELPSADRPLLEKGEASFAASGTNIRCIAPATILIATGGRVSRLFISGDKGNHWSDPIITGMLQAESSQGIFSIAQNKSGEAILVGGDYKQENRNDANVLLLRHNYKIELKPQKTCGGYRECVEYINDKTLISCGPNGTDISYNNGQDWEPLPDSEGFHVVRKSRKGNLIILAGKNGKIDLLQ
jgi:photosystem II stability/assembly factor-like uncharacterized protein